MNAPIASEDVTIAAVRSVREGDIRLGLQLARQEVRRARERGSQAEAVRAANAMAVCLGSHGRYIEAMAAATEAFRVAATLGDRAASVSAAATVAGASAFILESYEEAMDLLDRCLQDALAIGDASLEVHVRNARGVVLLKLRSFDASIAEYAAARSRLGETDGSLPESFLVSNMAGVAMRKAGAAPTELRAALQSDAEAALVAALAFAREKGNPEAQSRVHYSLGVLHLQRGEADRALDELARSGALATQVRNPYRIMTIGLESASIHAAAGRWAEAIAQFESALVAAEECRPCREMHLVQGGLARALMQAGDEAGAAKAHAAAERERAGYERECAHARRALNAFLEEFV